jgi:alkylated DNA repair protein alkB family protein 6
MDTQAIQTTPPLTKIHLPVSLEENRITTLPGFAYYISDFISEEEEQAILHKVSRPEPLASRPPPAPRHL